MIDEMIRERAFEISRREGSGTPEENWDRAERELQEELAQLDLDDDQ